MRRAEIILVRQVYLDIKPDSYRFEQAFSADGGKTWEANWIASVTRTQAEPMAPTADARDRSHDFDLNIGKWKTHVSRLTPPLAGSTKWVDYEGTSELSPVWHGRALLFEIRISGAAGPLEGMGLRLYDPRAHRWNISWANSKDGVIGVPIVGEFKNGRGELIDVEDFNGRQIFVRNIHSDLKPKSSRFEQAFSTDAGKTWETNWVMTFEAPGEPIGAAPGGG